MLGATQISGMRATAALALPDTATISRVARASDSAGGWTETWSTVASGVACRLMSTQNLGEGRAVGTQQATSEWMLTLPLGTDIRAADRVVVASRTFEVNSLLSAGVEWLISIRASVREVVA
jgi:head-tail adaptor